MYIEKFSKKFSKIFNGKWLGWFNKLRLLRVSLTIQHPSKVNSCDNNVEYSTSRIVYITRRNMKLFLENIKLRLWHVSWLWVLSIAVPIFSQCVQNFKKASFFLGVKTLTESKWVLSNGCCANINTKGEKWLANSVINGVPFDHIASIVDQWTKRFEQILVRPCLKKLFYKLFGSFQGQYIVFG